MSTQLNFGRDVQGFNAYAPQFSTNRYSANLLSTGNSSVTIPSNFGRWIASFSYQPGSTIWVALNTSAAPPVGNSFAQNVSELNPASKSVKSGDVINFYNNGSGASDVGVTLYAVSQ